MKSCGRLSCPANCETAWIRLDVYSCFAISIGNRSYSSFKHFGSLHGRRNYLRRPWADTRRNYLWNWSFGQLYNYHAISAMTEMSAETSDFGAISPFVVGGEVWRLGQFVLWHMSLFRAGVSGALELLLFVISHWSVGQGLLPVNVCGKRKSSCFVAFPPNLMSTSFFGRWEWLVHCTKFVVRRKKANKTQAMSGGMCGLILFAAHI